MGGLMSRTSRPRKSRAACTRTPPVKVAKDPGLPTALELEEHNATHLPHRSWCPVCMKARGREDAHKKGQIKGEKPIVSMDYKTFGENPGDDKITMIIMKDESTGCIAAHVCQSKGATDQWVVDRLCDDVELFGHTEVILKSDGEPAIVQVQSAIKDKRAHGTICQNSPAYNPQANGAAERAVQEVMGQVRAMKIGLQQRLNTEIKIDWKILEWLVELSTVLLNRCMVGKDGRTPYYRLMGKDSTKTIVELGERVLATIARGPQAGRKQALKSRWEDAVWVGIAKRSNEHIVVLEGGGPAIRCRTIKRRPADSRWSAELVAGIKATPRAPNPREPGEQRLRTERDPKIVKLEKEKVVAPPEVQAPREFKRRDFRITKLLLERYGFTGGCPGCQGMLDGKRGHVHSKECRDRIEIAMEADPEDSQRIRSRDQRAYEDPIDAEVNIENATPDEAQSSGLARGPDGHELQGQAPEASAPDANMGITGDAGDILYGKAEGDAAGEPQEEQRGPMRERSENQTDPEKVKRRKLCSITDETKKLQAILGMNMYDGNRQKLREMLKDMRGTREKGSSNKNSDITSIMNLIAEKEKYTPHDEEEDWQKLYDGVKFYDDLNAGGELDKNKVIEARKLEMQFFKKMGVYTKVHKSEVRANGGKTITTKWIDTDKGHGVYRSRLVGREIKMDKRQDLFSPTPPLETLKFLIASCAKGQGGAKPKRIGVFDVSRAYFYAKCLRPLYIGIPPEDWEEGDEDRVGVLNVSLYGTRDAAQNWAATYTEHLLQLGFKQGRASQCNFTHKGRGIRLTVHGDDFFVVADEAGLRWLEAQLKAKYEIKASILGPDASMVQEVRYLNRTLRWTAAGIDYESDSKHAANIVQECEVASGRASKVPGVAEKEGQDAGEPLTSSESTRFRAVAARMNYLAMDRADLQYTAKDLSRKMAAPTRGDWERARKAARYVKYRPRAVQHFEFEQEGSELSGYADSDWAGEKPSMKSTSGGVLMWGTSMLKSWSSTQNTIALSSAEAELYAMSKCAQQCLSISSLAADFDVILRPIIYSDATAAIGIAYRSGLGGKTRHVRVQYLWIQGSLQRKDLELEKVGTADNPADVLTKFVPSELMSRHVRWMGYEFPDQCGMEDEPSILRHGLKLYAKHLMLAEHQRQCVMRAFREVGCLQPRGGNGMYPPLGTHMNSHDWLPFVATLAL